MPIMLQIPEGQNKGHFSRLVEMESVQPMYVQIDLDRRRLHKQRLKQEEAMRERNAEEERLQEEAEKRTDEMNLERMDALAALNEMDFPAAMQSDECLSPSGQAEQRSRLHVQSLIQQDAFALLGISLNTQSIPIEGEPLFEAVNSESVKKMDSSKPADDEEFCGVPSKKL